MHETLQKKAYRAIRERLMSGVDGQGTRISDFVLSKELGISRAPIREAMSRLVSERLLDQKAGLGVFVPSPTRQEIEDLYQVREWLELSALEAGGRYLGPRDLEEMVQSCQVIRQMAIELEGTDLVLEKGKPFLQLNEVDADFHRCILQASRNKLVMELLQGHRVLEQLWSFYVRPHTAEVLHSICDEHQVVLDFLKASDYSGAREALGQHLRWARDATLAEFDAQESDV